jgi:hypothetical protein
MSYTGSKAQTGLGSILAINTASSGTPVYTTIGEITKLNQSGKKNNTDDVTNLESTDEEFITTIPSPGTYAFTVNRVSSDAGQAALLTAFNSGAKTLFKITMPLAPGQTTTGDTQAFTAIVEDYNDSGSIEPKKTVTVEGSLKVSGAITFTAGS